RVTRERKARSHSNKNMKTVTKFIYLTFAVAILAIGGSTANAGPGDIFVADFNTNTIYKFAPDGTPGIFANTGLNHPVGLAFDATGNLFEADDGTGRIYKFAPDGTPSIFATGLNAPRGLAFDNAGNLFEADYGSGTVRKFAPDGTELSAVA